MTHGQSHSHMRAAIACARRGLGRTGENPSVGCVIAQGARVLGAARTADGGRPHAETAAIADAAQRYGRGALIGAAAYVTLEPCAHHGQTAPCADALIQAGVSQVVYACPDPDPRVNGRGAARLRAAGVEVDSGVLRADAAETLRGFFSRVRRGRPFVTLKLAASLDGRIAAEGGDSRWITGSPARRRTHLIRAQSDAVMVGVGSALADDPMLTPRLPGFEDSRPIRIVADSRLQTPLTGALVRTAADAPVWLLCRSDADHNRRRAFETLGIRVIACPADSSGTLDLTSAMAALGAAGVNTVLCEGGGRLAAGLLRASLADELMWFSAGVLIGAEGAASTGGLGLERLADAPRWRLESQEIVGDDLLHIWRPAAKSIAAADL